MLRNQILENWATTAFKDVQDEIAKIEAEAEADVNSDVDKVKAILARVKARL